MLSYFTSIDKWRSLLYTVHFVIPENSCWAVLSSFWWCKGWSFPWQGRASAGRLLASGTVEMCSVQAPGCKLKYKLSGRPFYSLWACTSGASHWLWRRAFLTNEQAHKISFDAKSLSCDESCARFASKSLPASSGKHQQNLISLTHFHQNTKVYSSSKRMGYVF